MPLPLSSIPSQWQTNVVKSTFKRLKGKKRTGPCPPLVCCLFVTTRRRAESGHARRRPGCARQRPARRQGRPGRGHGHTAQASSAMARDAAVVPRRRAQPRRVRWRLRRVGELGRSMEDGGRGMQPMRRACPGTRGGGRFAKKSPTTCSYSPSTMYSFSLSSCWFGLQMMQMLLMR